MDNTWRDVTTYETGTRSGMDKEEMVDGVNEQVMEELKALGYIQWRSSARLPFSKV